MLRFVALAEIAPDRVEQLLDRAFGSDRHGRTAYSIRAGTDPIPALSFAALDGEALVGTIQCWPVALIHDDGRRTAMVMVGPVAVDPPRQQHGIGHALMGHMLDAARDTGNDAALMLIGDPEYYGRFFAFSAERTGGWRLPGPVERRRLLARGAGVPAAPGRLGPDDGAAAPAQPLASRTTP
ncbi:GNAT family N-acetyltransferase [Hephaestia mangrovi]|uniref:GNAT family N-acetyltransferase n=1 Tax=Hephaestia mangrovi TaxID=2873268 RepID=UPI001CA64665|nr:N-acetyltransferase [Hephaestia mangrovi]MBY8828775.1 N-acetyltransferase [Hephaestia mangrovi]